MKSILRFLKTLWSFWRRVADQITHVLNLIIVLLTYFLAIGPVGLTLRIVNKDPMDKAFDPENAPESYWSERPPLPTELERYERPF